MKRSRTNLARLRPASPRRGVTLVEMLVTVAVLVIMMTILVQIFQAATGSVTAAQSLQQLDDQLRRLDGLIRGDLEGVTARLTPPLDPAQNLGYFEYGENESSPTTRARTAMITFVSPPRPRQADHSQAECLFLLQPI